MLANPATQHCSPDMPKTASSKVQLPARRGEGSAKPSWQHSLRGGPAVQQLAYKGSAGARWVQGSLMQEQQNASTNLCMPPAHVMLWPCSVHRSA